MAQSRVEDQIGRILGDRYQLICLVGSGASGYVFLAEDARLGRRVAVKLLQTGLATDDAFLRRFRAEARGAAAMSHPHIMGVLDWGEEADGPYLVLEYLSGGSLRDLLDGGHRLSVEQAVRVGLEAAEGLAYAHRRDVVHRDIKPANLLFDEDGRLSIADFGLARALAEAAWTEPLGSLIGTVRYSSPEAAQGRTVDGQADVYALGLVLIEAVSGTAPFASDTAVSSLMARVAAPPEIPGSAGPLGPILAGMTRLDPADRPDSQALVGALQSLAADLPRPAPLPLVRPRVERDPTAPLSEAAAEAGRPSGAAGRPSGAAGRPSGAAGRPAVAAGPDRPPAEPMTEPAPRRRRRWPWLAALAVLVVAAAAVIGARAFLAVPSYHTPDVHGLTPANAALKLKPDKFHLVQGTAVYSPRISSGDVVSQQPAAGKLLKRGSAVDVELSKGPAPVAVPSLKGLPEATAQGRLKAVGLIPKISTGYSETVSKGDVINYTPDTGAHLPGTTVDVTVSLGPKPRIVPSFAPDTSYASAASTLGQIQLLVGKTSAYSTTVSAGDVISSDPGPGESVPRGYKVTLTVSLGPHLATIPDVDGETGAAATQALNAAGFNAKVFGPDPQGGSVVATLPLSGNTVDYGATVYVYVT